MQTAIATASMMPVNAAAQSSTALILLGHDEVGKAHASIFKGKDIPPARDAAAIMGMATLPVVGTEIEKLAASLPAGKLFDSGRAFVPFVKGTLYDQLHDLLPKADRVALAETSRLRRAAAESKAAASDEPENFTLPEDWSKIVVGDLILAYDPDDEAWFEAYVVETKGTDEFVLRWRNYPELPNFVRRRARIALLHPTYPIMA